MTNSIVMNKNISILLVLLVIGSWVHQWISIGTFISLDFSNFSFSFKWLLSNRNLLILILPLNFILFFFLIKKKNNNLIIFFILFLSYLIGTINFQINLFSSDVFKNEAINIYGSYENYFKKQLKWHFTFSLNLLCTILILSNLKSLVLDNSYKIIIFISLSFLFLICFLVFFQKGNLYTNPTYNLNIFGSNKIINSNGLSRGLIIIFIFLFSGLLLNSKKINFFLIFPSFLLSYLIIANEGRLNFISLLVAIILFLFLSSFSFKKKFFIFTLIFLIPLLTNIFVKTVVLKTLDGTNPLNVDLKEYISDLKKNRLFSLQGEIRGDLKEIVNLNTGLPDKCYYILNDNSAFVSKLNALTTGRIKKWQCGLNLENDFIFGNGPEYDRRILIGVKKNLLIQGEDIANGAIYALICGGIVGLCCYLLILFKYFNMCIHLLILKKKNYLINDLFFLSSFITVGYLVGRSLFENSFSSYGIDLLIFIPCYVFIFERFNMSENNYRNP
ncbi:O-antigen ligase family protein [Candidatus Pelagibacter sp.]|uniref:O-antigen ligase family protein n=1 Tax=Candidatus Pelagibacter sp. TaxID=2024849 RepID=UPI003D0F0586